MMNVSVFYEHIAEAARQTGLNITEIIHRIGRYGIKSADFDLWRLRDDSEAKDLLEKNIISVASVYNHFNFNSPDMSESKSEIREALELAASYGCKKFLAVPGFIGDNESKEEQLERMCSCLGYMCDYAKKYDITVMLEDYDDSNSPCSTADGLAYFFDAVPDLRFALDTGNFAYSCEDVMTAEERFSDRISYVHLKDRTDDITHYNGENAKADIQGKNMYPCAVGEGYIPIDKIISKLSRRGYVGDYAIEHFGADDQLDYIIRSAENIGEML